VYANITPFRPVLVSDLTPPAVTDVIDPNLKDASGFNADLDLEVTSKLFEF
jgi:Fe(3+) dicitrate transport protein